MQLPSGRQTTKPSVTIGAVMIDLTPLDVRNKRGDFKKLMRGYDPQEVDVFLEIVADRLAQPEGQWRPFSRTGLRRWVYPDPQRDAANEFTPT